MVSTEEPEVLWTVLRVFWGPSKPVVFGRRVVALVSVSRYANGPYVTWGTLYPTRQTPKKPQVTMSAVLVIVDDHKKRRRHTRQPCSNTTGSGVNIHISPSSPVVVYIAHACSYQTPCLQPISFTLAQC